MEALITSYGLDFKSFNDLLVKYKAIIAGSSVLSIYLDNVFTANDIDIWIPCSKSINAFLPIYKDLVKYFAKYDYDDEEVNKTEVTNERSKYTNLPTGRASIIKVLEFHNKDEKRVQFIFIDMNPIIFIKQTFDLSICMTWYNPKTQTIETYDKIHTNSMEMYINYNKEIKDLHPKNQARVEKYISRGFKLIPKPLPIFNSRDERIFTKNFKMEASDIILLEEVNVCDYIKESRDNIILKVGHSYYAYKRQELINELKKFDIPSLYYTLTPVKQAIISSDIDLFKYDDYSFYDIKLTSIKTSDKKHNIHKVKPLSVKEFENIYNENGIRDGLVKKFYEDGTIKSEITYTNSKKNGIKKKYTINGKIREEISYKDDKIHGIRTYYFDQLIIKIVNYDNNKIHGKSILYFPNTDYIVNIEANYKEGKLHGQYIEYDKSGEIVTKVIYENGSIKAPRVI